MRAFDAYDYIGAPWDIEQPWSRGVPWLSHAGNGGLSLRSRRLTLAVLDSVDYSRGEAEDCFIVEHLPRVGGRLAPRQVAATFALEAVDMSPDTVPLGFHAAYKYQGGRRMVELLRAAGRAYITAIEGRRFASGEDDRTTTSLDSVE